VALWEDFHLRSSIAVVCVLLVIGIDLGTTNSLVAVLREGEPIVLPNELGEELTPSVVAVAEDGALLIGRAARDRLIVDPQAGVSCFKRDMGTAATYRLGGQDWNPVTCSAVVLKEMRRLAELNLGDPVKEAVITVPAYFHDQQRQATIEAAEIVGLKVSRIVNEPTAAALAYGYRNPADEQLLLVFDLGGGTFDVSLLEVFDGVVEVKASAGESRLGGEDYTDALCDWIQKQASWSPAPGQLGRWRQQVEVTKCELATQEEVSVPVGEHTFTLDRAGFEEATSAVTARLRPVVTRCLRDAGVSADELDDILLVGGASRMPVVHSFLGITLKRIPNQRVDPDRVVALGAALQAALCNDDAAVGDIVLTDVCPHTLGVEVAKMMTPGQVGAGFYFPIIDRNTTVPVSRAEVFNTFHPSQDEIEVKVYQGEARMTRENQLIGRVRVGGMKTELGQRRPGEAEIRFSYDMNGILEVEVTVLSTGKKLAEVFEQRPGTLSKEQIREAIERLRPLKTHQRDLLVNRARLERAYRLFPELLGLARDRLDHLTDQFEAALEGQDPTIIQQAGVMLDQFLQNYYKLEAETRPHHPGRQPGND